MENDKAKLGQGTSNLSSKDEYVYRILPLQYFLQMVKKRKLYFPKINKWEDPYELFLFKQEYYDQNGIIVDVLSTTNSIYGQCWSTKRDSDALWRIYSPNKMSVRIKTTKKLIEQWKNENNGKSNILIQTDVVKYKSRKDVDAYIKGLTTRDIFNFQKLIDSIFIKRDSFEHEEEYRIIVWKADFSLENKYVLPEEYIEIPFEPEKFIQEVYLDPRLPREEADVLKHALSLFLGNKCSVSQSPLYKQKVYKILY